MFRAIFSQSKSKILQSQLLKLHTVSPLISLSSNIKFFSNDRSRQGDDDGHKQDKETIIEKIEENNEKVKQASQTRQIPDQTTFMDEYSQTKKITETEFGMDEDETVVRALQGDQELHKEDGDDKEDDDDGGDEEDEFNDAAGYEEANLSKDDIRKNIILEMGYANRLKKQAIQEAAIARGELQKQRRTVDDFDNESSEKGKIDLNQFTEYEKRLGKIAVELQREPASSTSAERFDKLISFQGLLSPEFLEYQEKKRLAGADKFYMQLIDIKMVCKQTGKGGIYKYSAMVVVGNLKGVVGYGLGKSAEPNSAVAKATQQAIKEAKYVPLYRGHTIYWPVNANFQNARLRMYPRERGFGLVAHPIFMEICELMGIRDISCKIHGSRNTRNNVKCFVDALQGMQSLREKAVGSGKYWREVTVITM